MKTLLIDAKNTLYRHNYTSKLVDPEGNKVSGVFGMVKDVTNQIRKHRPDNVIIAWDVGKSKGRLALYEEYKANRKKDDKELLENLLYQTKMAKQIFKCLPVKQIGVKDVEADDIIGFLCNKLKGKKIIFSNDSDFYQLIDKNVLQFVPKQSKMFNKIEIEKLLGFDKKYYVVWKAMVGDTSDNIIGIKGIGAKTASKIVKKEKEKKFNESEKEIINRNIKLIKIGGILTKEDKKTIINKYKKEKSKPPNTIMLRGTFRKLGFKSLLVNFNGIISEYKELQ